MREQAMREQAMSDQAMRLKLVVEKAKKRGELIRWVMWAGLGSASTLKVEKLESSKVKNEQV